MASKRLSHYLTPIESDMLLQTCRRATAKGRRNYAILKLLLGTGLRRGELIKLNRSDFKFNDGYLTFLVKGKGGYERTAWVRDTEVWKALEVYWNSLNFKVEPATPAFLALHRKNDHRYRRISKCAITGLVRMAVKLAGLDKRITPHSLRHTFLTRQLQSGTDVRTVQALAGHKAMTSTMRYLHTDEERCKRAMAGFSI